MFCKVDNKCKVTDSKNCDLIQMVEKLEKHWEEIYQNAKGQIKEISRASS